MKPGESQLNESQMLIEPLKAVLLDVEVVLSLGSCQAINQL